MTNQKKMVLGNWKMHFNQQEALAYAEKMKTLLATNPLNCEFGIAPTSLHLNLVNKILKESKLMVIAQEANAIAKGAFTGLISYAQLASDGIEAVIIGHSETRQLFKFTDEEINQKIITALAAGLKIVFCFGENLEEYEANKTMATIEEQIRMGLKSIKPNDYHKIIFAYEPIWAIGTGKVATVQHAQDIANFIRNILTKLTTKEDAKNFYILYGGSVNSDNIEALAETNDINGFLVGGASLNPEAFYNMARLLK